jgi:hypothetical protein
MNIRIGYSSELYEIDPKDLINLNDLEEDIKKQLNHRNEVILFIGNENTNEKDKLAFGRKTIEKAINNGEKYIKIRVAYKIRTPRFDFLSTLIKKRRLKYRGYSTNIYHTSPFIIREMSIERNIRTSENAYDISNPKWYLPPQERKKKYNKLYNSMKKNGFNDKFPLEIMLNRSFGVQDTLQQGHHRMCIAMDLKLEKIAIKFSAVGQNKNILSPLFKILAKRKLKSKFKK